MTAGEKGETSNSGQRGANSVFLILSRVFICGSSSVGDWGPIVSITVVTA